MRTWPARPRDTWLTSVLGAALLTLIPVIAITGLLSNAAYDPRLGVNVLAQGRSLGPLDFYLFTWPSQPSWLYAFTQGLHVTLGLAAFPIVLAKLWSVLGRMFTAPTPTVAGMLERLFALLLVVAILFESFTGLFEIEYFTPFGAQVIAAHYYGAWVVIAAFVLHAGVKLPTVGRSLALRRELEPLAAATAPGSGSARSAGGPARSAGGPARSAGGPARSAGGPARSAATSAPPAAGAAPMISRRTLLGTTVAGSLILLVQGAAQAVGGPVRPLAVLAPRGFVTGSGPNDFEVNGTFEETGISHQDIGVDWRLRVGAAGGIDHALSRQQLLDMPQHTYSLPIACREGWSTTQRWTGVRLRDLAALVGVREASTLSMQSLDGATAWLAANQVAAEQSLLVLRVNGVDLSADHGYPARVVVPAVVGVSCLKWIDSLRFDEQAG